MIQGAEKFRRFLKRHPHPHHPFFERPLWSRRQFFRLAGAGVTGAWIAKPLLAGDVDVKAQVKPVNRAKQVIFIFLTGAPSHIDTFDLKEVPGVTPTDFQPTTINNLRWPVGLMPKLAERLGDIAIVRSVRAWALVHSLAQTWAQIGRNPTSALGAVAPNIGSIIALEKEPERRPDQVFPAFLALNSAQAIGSGYLSAQFAPFKYSPVPTGLPNTTNPDGEARSNDRWQLLNALDGNLRINSPLGRPPEDMHRFYVSARNLMYNPVVDQAFRIPPQDAARYGDGQNATGIGTACLIAKQVIAARQGTRFIQITLGGWDMHQDIYDRRANPRANLYVLAAQLDSALAALITDLKAAGLWDETLIVMMGEFGRTVGPLTPDDGRDHYLQQFCVFAGAGVKGGRAIGSTDASGGQTAEYGWSRERDVRIEDIEATIYSAMGINWTTVRYDDPFGRGFEYVPYAGEDLYGPIHELWRD